MPNPDNILSPITLFAYNRSGTSLTQAILRAHPHVDTCGETAAMLFGTWHAMDRTQNVIRPDRALPKGAAHDQRSAKAVRAVFLATFASDAPRWMQKPIGVPWVMKHLRARETSDREPEGWYWNAFNQSFPQARAITILRHPYDVALSAMEWMQSPAERVLNNIVGMARILMHPDAPVRFALSYDRLVNEPEAEIARLLQHLDLPFDAACVDAVRTVYVHKRGVGPLDKADLVGRRAGGFSRRDAWDRLDKSSLDDADRSLLIDLWARHGETLEL